MCELFVEKNCQIEIFHGNAWEAKKIAIINSRLTNLNKLVFLYQIVCPPSELDPKKCHRISQLLKFDLQFAVSQLQMIIYVPI